MSNSRSVEGGYGRIVRIVIQRNPLRRIKEVLLLVLEIADGDTVGLALLLAEVPVDR